MMFFKSVPTVSWSTLDKDAVIIDVREVREFQQGHAPGAKNIPLSKLDKYKISGKVYVVCASGARSKRAVKSLRKQGIEAINIRGGMMLYGK